jgi:hypothetical protein
VAKGNVHPLDSLSQELWDSLRKRVGWAKEALGGPVPLGQRRATAKERMDEFMRMGPMHRMALGDKAVGLRGTMINALGEHALNILPYIGEDEEEAMP